jgi:hypothetical protein
MYGVFFRHRPHAEAAYTRAGSKGTNRTYTRSTNECASERLEVLTTQLRESLERPWSVMLSANKEGRTSRVNTWVRRPAPDPACDISNQEGRGRGGASVR